MRENTGFLLDRGGINMHFPGKGAGPGFSLSVGPLALPPAACRAASADLFLGFLDFLENWGVQNLAQKSSF